MKRIFPVALTLALAAPLFAGGFWIEIGTPSANAEARQNNAVLLARVTGCHDPAKAVVSATAEGIVNGQPRSIALHPVRLTLTGAYAIKHEWRRKEAGR